MLESKNYFISQINSSKAYQFTCQYHYSHVGFKKATINLGIFEKEELRLVGVLQWGCSAQEGIRLDRYVNEPITKEEYLELNRFCMADSEGKNSESEAIALGVKWIKQNCPKVKLLVSYAGRKEGNYGYIYQATNWEYLGYFISSGFWQIDGQEMHQLTLWYHYKKYGNKFLPFNESITEMYSDVRQTWSKQFIYIKRLSRDLTPTKYRVPYPKPSTEYPIVTKVKIYKEGTYTTKSIETYNDKEFFYDEEEPLFTRRTLIRQGKVKPVSYRIGVYSISGELEGVYDYIKDINIPGYTYNGIAESTRTTKKYKDKYFRKYPVEMEMPEQIDVPSVCIYDNITFYTMPELAEYCHVSRQAVHSSRQRKASKLLGKEITWL